MRIITAIVAIAAAFTAFGADVKPTEAKPRPKFSPMYRKTGGMLQRPGVRPGRIAVFNGQKSVATGEIAPTVKRLEKIVHAEMPVLDRETPADVSARIAATKEMKADFALFVVEEPANPCSLGVFPDQRIAFVNVAALRFDGGEGAFLVARTRKEIIRAFLMLCGGSSSQSSQNMMGGMKSIRDLDKFPEDAIPVDVIGRTLHFLPDAGCNIRTMVPYRTACKEGWAPAPTNDVQRAIWNQIHAIPKNPMKIEFDPKKGR